MIWEMLTDWPVLLVAAAVILILLASRRFAPQDKPPYKVRDGIVTSGERQFYRRLVEAIDNDWLVFAKVRIADVLSVKSGTKKRMSWQNKINQKHVDFVLCDKETLKFVMAIELDDRSHERPDRIKRDIFVNAAFESAKLPLLRIKTAKDYEPSEIRERVENLLSPRKRRRFI